MKLGLWVWYYLRYTTVSTLSSSRVKVLTDSPFPIIFHLPHCCDLGKTTQLLSIKRDNNGAKLQGLLCESKESIYVKYLVWYQAQSSHSVNASCCIYWVLTLSQDKLMMIIIITCLLLTPVLSLECVPLGYTSSLILKTKYPLPSPAPKERYLIISAHLPLRQW